MATLPNQPAYQNGQRHAYNDIMNDPNNAPIIKEMEDEISVWIIRLICYFLFVLIIYTDLNYNIPLAIIQSPLTLLDGYLIFYYYRKHKINR